MIVLSDEWEKIVSESFRLTFDEHILGSVNLEDLYTVLGIKLIHHIY